MDPRPKLGIFSPSISRGRACARPSWITPTITRSARICSSFSLCAPTVRPPAQQPPPQPPRSRTTRNLQVIRNPPPKTMSKNPSRFGADHGPARPPLAAASLGVLLVFSLHQTGFGQYTPPPPPAPFPG